MFVNIRSMLVLLTAVSVLFGCSSGGSGKSVDKGGETATGSSSPSPEKQDPVKLKIAISMGWLGPDEFQKYFDDPVKKKYPNISFEIYDQGKAEFNLDKLVAAGDIPDIVMQASALSFRYTGYGLESDIQPLIKKYNFDLSKLDPVALDAVKTSSGSKVLTGLPWTRHFSALYYNKDIFNKFGVEYPKDGMTWDQLKDVAAKMTRKEGDVQYRGLEPDQPGSIASVLSIPAFDPVTKKATINNDSWKKIFTMLKSIYDIPGNNATKFAQGAWDQFTKEKTLAMYPTNNRLPQLKDFTGLNWDIAQYPSFPEAPNTGMGIDVWILHITETSKHKDEAFKAIATILSDEVQTDMARNARFPVVVNSKVQEEFGKNLPYVQGKHLDAAFKAKPAKAMLVSQYDSFSGAILQGAITKVAAGELDINTALRNAEDEYNQKVQAMAK